MLMLEGMLIAEEIVVNERELGMVRSQPLEAATELLVCCIIYVEDASMTATDGDILAIAALHH